ncbi:hypothetical protein SUGI_0504890 [Cryptomeria japonica]|nr:hypothetical protein SUGI_0504890 [Cryptomeria japonica]
MGSHHGNLKNSFWPSQIPAIAMYSEPKLKSRKPGASEMLSGISSPSKNFQKFEGTPLINLEKVVGSNPGKASMCLCSPTSHAGSFRCHLHRSSQTQWAVRSKGSMVTMQPKTSSASTIEAQ